MPKPSLLDRLKTFASSALLDASIASESDYTAAVAQAKEMIGSREVSDVTALDIAVFRFKLRLKVMMSEEDLLLYQNAIKAVNNAPIKGDDSKGGGFKYAAV
jgi:hypothetical protein